MAKGADRSSSISTVGLSKVTSSLPICSARDSMRITRRLARPGRWHSSGPDAGSDSASTFSKPERPSGQGREVDHRIVAAILASAADRLVVGQVALADLDHVAERRQAFQALSMPAPDRALSTTSTRGPRSTSHLIGEVQRANHMTAATPAVDMRLRRCRRAEHLAPTSRATWIVASRHRPEARISDLVRHG